MVAINPGSIVELTHSSDRHFEQFFVAHSVSIQGFAMGCWPIIAIDSAHIGTSCLLHSVPEVFGLENHAYCYCHLKENFSSFLANITQEGTKVNKMHSNSLIALPMQGSMFVKHKDESNNWKGSTGQKLKTKCCRKLPRHTCTCRGWQMMGILCEHATTVILSIGQNVADFVQDWYKFPMQELIYLGSFFGIETHDMPFVDNDGLVRSIIGEFFFSLNPPHTKRSPIRPKKKCIESQFQDKRTVYCSRCHMSKHNRKACKNPLS
ncbi:hypothetical protein CK203_049535 [Vitis vinifera]|uniref:SWIM-type domain-containing protein n=1 Tax=Vitis vinifera TaxID=29760 RepID=A0A438HBP1_VITVI|nr:hypothetical protein CK203_049535 [Vitis vinifera]